MTAQIRTRFARDVYVNFSSETISYFAYNVHSSFAGTSYDYCAWTFLGNVSRYSPAIKGHESNAIIISPNELPGGYSFPQVNVDNLSQADAFFRSYAETFVNLASIEAEREEWHAMMLAAEAAEVRAHAILSDSPAVPPF